MNQDILPSSVPKQPDGSVLGPHLTLSPEELDSKRREMSLGRFMTNEALEGLNQLERHAQAVQDNGWNPEAGSTYTEADKDAHILNITAADAALRNQGVATKELHDKTVGNK